MKRVVIIGGETHLNEITNLQGSALTIVGTCMRAEQINTALPNLAAPNFDSPEAMFAAVKPDIVAVSNENDLKADVIMAALHFGCDIIADKPLCLTMAEQQELETWLADHPRQRLLNLLTLRGNPGWQELHDQIRAGQIGQPAFVHIRMAVKLKRTQRPPWFLDWRRAGGLFLDLLIHGLDQVEWLTGTSVVAMTANMGNLGVPDDPQLRDHAAVYCELSNGGSAVVEGQRLLPETKASDYRAMVAGAGGYADLDMAGPVLRITNAVGADQVVATFPDSVSVVKDWLNGGDWVPQAASLRANRLAVLATQSALEHRRVMGP
ncbi:MAG: Gfo/Idh/MocA family oxidoreductase [Verrucomicrobia bacterium]|nr:Gfo/Idh/MocA family oxidoreductase [Verrucomicrobiota bacterium]MBU1736346.1 Gfo/Idh/MocA family oxidoreductase [Verrucomicrobiota bacterium]MBU1857351.1 Gfo/Idh/MocA family oxidoreductase [Verrucomicrobiota bacterium]